MPTTLVSALVLSLSSTTAIADINLAERTIPTPVGISTTFVEMIEGRGSIPEIPVPESTEAWLEFQSMFDAPGVELAKSVAERFEVTYEAKPFAGVDTFFVTPKVVSSEYQDKWLVHIHGGAFVLGGGESALREAIWVANGLGAKVISVDYRQPPLHPFPAAIDDAVAVWKDKQQSRPLFLAHLRAVI